MKETNHLLILFLLCLFIASCNTPSAVVKQEDEAIVKSPKNIILLIGDGMGLTQITAGLYMNSNFLNIERFPIVGLHKNYASDNLVTDSAAGATAFSCGVKTYNGAIGVDSDTIAIETILENASKVGIKTGLVSTSSIVHATPASFAAHRASRNMYEDIALDMSNSGVDLMIGGGKSFFDRRSTDSLNLYHELENKGYAVSDYFEQDFQDVNVSEMGDKWAFFTSDKEPLSKDAGRDYLLDASEVAINFLDSVASEGFFLMIEGSQIDWAGHANNFEYLVSEMLEYDNVVKQALDFAEKDGNTLVILTADHETGGLAIQTGSKMDSLVAAYTSDYHTATMIPVFAYGPGSQEFSGIYENTAIYDKMMSVFNLKKNTLNPSK